MKRILSASAVLSMLAALGCSPAVTAPRDASDAKAAGVSSEAPDTTKDAAKDAAVAPSDADTSAVEEAASAAADKVEPAADEPAAAPWAVGDFVVYRASGSFHKAPVTLTEKVIARKGDSFTLEVTYDDGKNKESIRAQMKGDSPMRAEVVSVARLVNGAERPAGLALYEELLSRVTPVADQNEAQLGTESVKLNVAGHGSVACERATYRVKLGQKTATMHTIASAGFVWGDVGADITSEDGQVIYKVEVIDAGHAAAPTAAVASADDDY